MDTIQTKSREIIGQVYEEMRTDVYSIFRQACIPEEDCEDLVQEVFVKVLNLDIIQPESLKALVARMAYQKRTDYFRHRFFINKVHEDMRGWAMDCSYTNTVTEVNDILHIEMKAIHCMSDLDRKTYELSRFDDRTSEEIALTLNLTKKAVDSRLYRTRLLVRNTLKKAIGY
jgi:RNA polymerase sigma factor (sigma-70 family)